MKFLSVYPLQRLARSGSFLYNSWFICDSPVTIQKNSGRWHKRSNRRAASLLRKHNMIIYHWGVGDGHNRRGGGWFRVWHQFLMTVKQYWKLGASQTSAVGGRGGGGFQCHLYRTPSPLLPPYSQYTLHFRYAVHCTWCWGSGRNIVTRGTLWSTKVCWWLRYPFSAFSLPTATPLVPPNVMRCHLLSTDCFLLPRFHYIGLFHIRMLCEYGFTTVKD